jgi:hypothetical protein
VTGRASGISGISVRVRRARPIPGFAADLGSAVDLGWAGDLGWADEVRWSLACPLDSGSTESSDALAWRAGGRSEAGRLGARRGGRGQHGAGGPGDGTRGRDYRDGFAGTVPPVKTVGSWGF